MFEKKGNHDYVTRAWSGGQTTEILIAPEDSCLTKRNFDFRLSTATVASKTTEFSDFTGYERFIMSLDAPITLQHQNIMIPLQPFEIYRFDGGTTMQSHGKCQDFNVIFKKKYQVSVTVLQNNETVVLFTKGQSILYALQTIKVEVSALETVAEVSLQKGESLVLKGQKQLHVISQKTSFSRNKVAVLTQIKE